MARKRTRPSYQGVVLWVGPSELDGRMITVVATGYQTQKAYANRKLGGAIQVWMLDEEFEPHDAIVEGLDASVCGDCELRGEGAGRGRGCYVHIPFLTMIWKAYRDGSYDLLADVMERVEADNDIDPFKDWIVRIGSYGDPAAVPIEVWDAIDVKASRVFGYTRQWRRAESQDLRRLVMASCFTPAEQALAQSMGWRTFRGMQPDEEPGEGEILCPHASHGTTCVECALCSGRKVDDRRANITVPVHGAARIKNAYARAAGRLAVVT